MTDDELACSRCGTLYEISLGQSAKYGILRWSASYVCPSCRERQEIDGIALPPPDWRSTILANEGVHVLTIEPGADRVSTLRQLQTVLCLSAVAVAPLARKIPGAVISGTPYEMEWLVGVLGSGGIPATSAAKDPSSASGAIDLADLVGEDWPDRWTPPGD